MVASAAAKVAAATAGSDDDDMMALPPPSEPKPPPAGAAAAAGASHEEELTDFQRKMLELMEKKKEEAERKVGGRPPSSCVCPRGTAAGRDPGVGTCGSAHPRRRSTHGLAVAKGGVCCEAYTDVRWPGEGACVNPLLGVPTAHDAPLPELRIGLTYFAALKAPQQ